jgi:hypothetical protein
MGKGLDKIEALRQSHPFIHIAITREHDVNDVWDGENQLGPEYVSYLYTVTASRIVDGLLFEGRAYLGSCWYKPNDRSDCAREISGYLSDMVDDAIEALDTHIREYEGER